jgi:hypothetical protein
MVIEYSTGVRRDGDKETAPEATLASSLDDTYGDTRGNCGAVTSWLFISLKRPFSRHPKRSSNRPHGSLREDKKAAEPALPMYPKWIGYLEK